MKPPTSESLNKEKNRLDRAKTIFQDAVLDVFADNPSTPQERAHLRDLVADISCPKDISDDLKSGREQLDATEFLNFFLDSVLPKENNLEIVSTVAWQENSNQKSRQVSIDETKLDISFPAHSDQEIVDCSKMLAGYQDTENLISQFDTGEKKVDATKELQPKVKNPNAEIIISLKRFKYEKGTNGIPVKRKIHTKVNLDDIELSIAGGEGKKKYRATSFIVHIGGDNSGHYVTYVQEEDNKWYCYNDEARTKVADYLREDGTTVTAAKVLDNAKSQAYVVKYSPINDDEKCNLPKSQSNGTRNGGNRCWANAAFAFALSMTSLHKKDHARSEPKTPILEASKTTPETESKVNKLVNLIMDLDDPRYALKDVLTKIKDISPKTKTETDNKLREIGFSSIEMLLKNYLLFPKTKPKNLFLNKLYL